jgi:septal ring factor EnvC (AmiA/AmiB activator)
METEWLDELEARVREAAARLRELKSRNGELERRIADLETQLAATPGQADWEAERDDVRRRVEKLAASLEDLLDE